MKTLRLCLLLLLAVLLPVRGVFAGAMLCQAMGSGGVGGTQQAAGWAPHGADTADGMHAAASHEHAAHHAGRHAGHHVAHDAAGGAAAHDGHGHGTFGKCNMCGAFCSLTPFVSGALTWPGVTAAVAVRFPEVCPPAPSFVSEGPERPPRSC